MTIKRPTLIFSVHRRLVGMCHKTKMAAPADGNSKENINMGLINVSSNSQSIISVETVLEILSFAILALLLCRWIKKCMIRRKMESERRLASIIKPDRPQTTSFMEMPSAPRAIMGPMGPVDQMGVQPMQQRQSCPEVFTGPIGLDKYR